MKKTLIWHLATKPLTNGGHMPPPPQHELSSLGALVLADRSDEVVADGKPVRKVQWFMGSVGAEITETRLLGLVTSWFDRVDTAIGYTSHTFGLPVLTNRCFVREVGFGPLLYWPSDTKYVDLQEWFIEYLCGPSYKPGFDLLCGLLRLPPRIAPLENGAQLPTDCLIIALAHLRVSFLNGSMERDEYIEWTNLLQTLYCSRDDAFSAYF